MSYVDPLGLFGFSIGFAAGGTFGGIGGGGSLEGYYSHNDASPWYSGWSSGVGLSLWGGAGVGYTKNEQEAMSAYWGVEGSLNNTNNACQVANKGVNAGRLLGGPVSLYGYKGSDYMGGGVMLGGGLGTTVATAGPSWTGFSGGNW